jgi:hypothetical protein
LLSGFGFFAKNKKILAKNARCAYTEITDSIARGHDMKFDFSSDAMKAISKLDTKTAGRIIKGIMGLPNKGDIKPIVESNGSYRLRIGDFRIWFSCPELLY